MTLHRMLIAIIAFSYLTLTLAAAIDGRWSDMWGHLVVTTCAFGWWRTEYELDRERSRSYRKEN